VGGKPSTGIDVPPPPTPPRRKRGEGNSARCVTMANPLIFFAPSGKRGRFPEGTTVLDAARKLGVDLDSVCGGRGICGRCQIEIGEGKFSKLGIVSSSESVTGWNGVEQRYVSKRGPLGEGRRLGCQAKLCGDVVIDVPADSQVHRQVVRKSAAIRDIKIEPVVTLHYVEVREPDMHDPSSDYRRLQEALEAQWGLKDIAAPLESLRLLQPSLRQGQWSVTCAVRHGREIVGIWPGLHEQAVGLAVDIGSTTIAAHLCDLASGEVLASSGVMNPQIRFGEDVMSRVSYVMMNPGGDVELTQSVREAIGELAVAVTAEAGLQ
jgi:uncharacterized 2Fe-2S/4Fe-4S cluster protein (DUF4445 family)